MSQEVKIEDYADVKIKKFPHGLSSIHVSVSWSQKIKRPGSTDGELFGCPLRISECVLCSKWLYEQGGLYTKWTDWLVERLINKIVDQVREDVGGHAEVNRKVRL